MLIVTIKMRVVMIDVKKMMLMRDIMPGIMRGIMK